MADYKTLHGSNIEVVSSDPSNPVGGQVWYNTTSNVMKGFTENPVGSWSSGTAITTARFYIGGSGTVTAGLVWGGQTAPGSKVTINESWNGTAWTEVGDLNTGRRSFSGTGTQTAAITAGGFSTEDLANTETWNGTSWTEVGDLNTAKTNIATSRGSTTVMLVFGAATTESFNGSAWTEVADVNTIKGQLAGAGVDNTSALAFGGYDPSPAASATTEIWNGSSWTEVGDLNVARGNGTGVGVVDSALHFGGYNAALTPAYPVDTEEWNGTSWTERANFSANRSAGGSFGTAEACFLSGGSPPAGGALTTVEEWVAPITSTVTFDASDVQVVIYFKQYILQLTNGERHEKRHKRTYTKRRA